MNLEDLKSQSLRKLADVVMDVAGAAARPSARLGKAVMPWRPQALKRWTITTLSGEGSLWRKVRGIPWLSTLTTSLIRLWPR